MSKMTGTTSEILPSGVLKVQAALHGLFGKAEIHVETLDDNIRMTAISTVVMDQAGLVGLIRRLHGLGIVLISIRQVEI